MSLAVLAQYSPRLEYCVTLWGNADTCICFMAELDFHIMWLESETETRICSLVWTINSWLLCHVDLNPILISELNAILTTEIDTRYCHGSSVFHAVPYFPWLLGCTRTRPCTFHSTIFDMYSKLIWIWTLELIIDTYHQSGDGTLILILLTSLLGGIVIQGIVFQVSMSSCFYRAASQGLQYIGYMGGHSL